MSVGKMSIFLGEREYSVRYWAETGDGQCPECRLEMPVPKPEVTEVVDMVTMSPLKKGPRYNQIRKQFQESFLSEVLHDAATGGGVVRLEPGSCMVCGVQELKEGAMDPLDLSIRLDTELNEKLLDVERENW